jgi:exonuclease III
MSHSVKRLSCLTLNVNGLQSQDKRTALFHYLLRSTSSDALRYDVVMLQETHHASEAQFESWLTAGAGPGRPVSAQLFHSEGSTSSAGVVMLFAEHLHASDFAVTAAIEGRLLAVSCQILGQPFHFVNVYAPHQASERCTFFSTVLQMRLPPASSHANTTSIWGGDWNCIECPDLDQSGASQARESGFHDALSPVLAEHGMHDAFRTMHPAKRAFSFAKVTAAYSTFSRLDKFYVSDSCVPHLHAAKYEDSLPSSGVDHRACILSVRIPDAPVQGPGVWSFPSHLLWDDISMKRIRHIIEAWLHAHPVGADGTAMGRWLDLKIYLKQQSILAGMQYNQLRAQHRRQVARRAGRLADRWAANPSSTHCASAYSVASMLSSSVREQEARKAAKLAGAAWCDFGERCTAWFHRLGRQRKQATVLHSVRAQGAPDSVDLRSDSGVVEGGNIIADFFDSGVQGSLFFPGETDAQEQQVLLGALDGALDDGDRAVCEAELTLEELEEALRKCATSKRPGLDGLPYELYSELWDVIGEPLLEAWNECMAAPSPRLPAEMMQGCIVLLYKGQGDREDLANYRPITLLNADYKLIAKAYAMRFGGPAATVVDDTQTAFLPGAWIGDNVLHHLEEVDYCEAVQQKGCILFLDFAKAYDRMDRPWLLECMHAMRFGPQAIAVVRCLLEGSSAVCMYNGHLTRSFPVSSGVAQGSPLSPLLYVLAAQPLAARIRQLKEEGVYQPIRQPDGEAAPGSHQHADDTTIHAASAEDAELIVERAVEPFCRATNAKLNAGKTKVLLLGGALPPGAPRSGIPYPTTGEAVVAVRHLGIMLAPGAVGVAARNAKFVSIQGAMRSRMLHWSRHSLSALGRAHVAKQCLASMFVYHATFSSPTAHLLSQLDGCIARFVHEGPFPPNRTIAQLPTELGGISLASIPAASTALHAFVVCRYLSGVRKSWHAFWDFWFGAHPASWERPVDHVRYGKRLLLMPVDFPAVSPHIPARVVQHVRAFQRGCGLSRIGHPSSVQAVAQEPVFFQVPHTTPPSCASHFVRPVGFQALRSAGVRLVADLHNMWLQRDSLHPLLRLQVEQVYSYLPAAWKQLLPSHPVPVPDDADLPLASFAFAAELPIHDVTVKLLTRAALRVAASKKATSVPVRPALLHWGDASQQQLLSLEQRWIDVCERGTRLGLGVRRTFSDADLLAAYSAGAEYVRDPGYRGLPRLPPRERGGHSSSRPAAATPNGPLALQQQTRGPSVMGPLAMHASCWRRLSVSYIHEEQPPHSEWAACWGALWCRGLTRESVWVLWRLAHGALPCGALKRCDAIQQRRADVPDGLCKQQGCEGEWDTLTHAYFECPVARVVWDWVARLYGHVVGGDPPPVTADVVLCGVTRPVWSPRSDFWHLVRSAAVGCLYRARCKAYMSGVQLSPTRIACCVVNELRAIIVRDWIAASRCLLVRRLYGTPARSPAGRRQKFKDKWEQLSSLCSVTAGVVTVHLSPFYPVPVPR